MAWKTTKFWGQKFTYLETRNPIASGCTWTTFKGMVSLWVIENKDRKCKVVLKKLATVYWSSRNFRGQEKAAICCRKKTWHLLILKCHRRNGWTMGFFLKAFFKRTVTFCVYHSFRNMIETIVFSIDFNVIFNSGNWCISFQRLKNKNIALSEGDDGLIKESVYSSNPSNVSTGNKIEQWMLFFNYHNKTCQIANKKSGYSVVKNKLRFGKVFWCLKNFPKMIGDIECWSCFSKNWKVKRWAIVVFGLSDQNWLVYQQTFGMKKVIRPWKCRLWNTENSFSCIQTMVKRVLKLNYKNYLRGDKDLIRLLFGQFQLI